MARVLVYLLIVLLAAGASVILLFGVEIARARAMASHGSRVIETAAGPIEYGDAGEGVVLLSIHGAGGGFDQGLANAAGLIGEGFRVVAPSRFGYLKTPVPADSSPAAQADAHSALLNALGIERAVVAGISAGARSAAAFALRYPERTRALILIVPATYAPANPVAIEESRGSALAFWLVNAGADFAWWAMERIAPSVLIRFIGVPPEIADAATPQERERVMEIVARIQPLSQRSAGINIDSIAEQRRPHFEEIAVPTLVITARDDLFNTLPAAEFAAAAIPDAKLTVFETGGHLLVGHAGAVRALIGDFLNQAGDESTQP